MASLAKLHVGALLVIDDDHLVGIISERDIVRHIGMGGATDAPVMACGTHNPVTISPDTAVTRCMHVMTEHRVRHLPVLNDDAVVGIISIGDVVKNQLATKDFLLDQYGQYFGGADAS